MDEMDFNQLEEDSIDNKYKEFYKQAKNLNKTTLVIKSGSHSLDSIVQDTFPTAERLGKGARKYVYKFGDDYPDIVLKVPNPTQLAKRELLKKGFLDETQKGTRNEYQGSLLMDIEAYHMIPPNRRDEIHAKYYNIHPDDNFMIQEKGIPITEHTPGWSKIKNEALGYGLEDIRHGNMAMFGDKIKIIDADLPYVYPQKETKWNARQKAYNTRNEWRKMPSPDDILSVDRIDWPVDINKELLEGFDPFSNKENQLSVKNYRKGLVLYE
jgi:hypothetical protein